MSNVAAANGTNGTTTTNGTAKKPAAQIRPGNRDGLFDITRVYVGDARAALIAIFELAAGYLDDLQEPVSPALARQFAAGVVALHEIDLWLATIEKDNSPREKAAG
jgi:hypothetical protein